VANVAQVRVDGLDHVGAGVPQLARDRIDRDRLPTVERLQPGGAVGVAERLRADVARFGATPVPPKITCSSPARATTASSALRQSIRLSSPSSLRRQSWVPLRLMQDSRISPGPDPRCSNQRIGSFVTKRCR
jgi:hypothetical protein